MRLRLAPLGCAFALIAVVAHGQGALNEVLSGALIEPETGVYAWYELTDKESAAKYFLRQAIVGEERVKRKKGYWVETEVIPQVGFPAIYKMLLTGPASEAKNVHEIIVKEGEAAPQRVPIEETSAEEEKQEEGTRTAIGTESVETLEGAISTEHFRIEGSDGVSDLWINESVRPTGIVKLVSPQGQLILQRFGKGGPDAESKLGGAQAPDQGERRSQVQVRVGEGPTTNFSGREPRE